MKEIIRQYGGAILVALVTISICFLMININYSGNKGVFSIAADYIEKSNQTVLMADNSKNLRYNYLKAEGQPELYACASSQILANSEFVIGEYIKISDESKGGSYEIYEIRKADNTVYTTSLLKPTDRLILTEPGKYELFMHVFSANGLPSYAKVCIPVNRGIE